jgi:hypothetical protein
MIGLRDHRRIDRRRPISRCRPHGPLDIPTVTTPLMLSRARLSLFGPRVRESTRTVSGGAFRRQATGERLSELARQLLLDPGPAGSPALARSGATSTRMLRTRRPDCARAAPFPIVVASAITPQAAIAARRSHSATDMTQAPARLARFSGGRRDNPLYAIGPPHGFTMTRRPEKSRPISDDSCPLSPLAEGWGPAPPGGQECKPAKSEQHHRPGRWFRNGQRAE